MIFVVGCSHARYKPVVKYSHPSHAALKTTLRSTHGDRYIYAAQGPNKFDCSGLVYYNYATMNLWLPRRAIDQSKVGKTVSVNELKYGDLIFFDTHRHFRGRVNHVGIYVGNGLFTHASSAKRRVTTSSLNKRFYRSRIVVCKRLMLNNKCQIKRSVKPLKVQNHRVTDIVEKPTKTKIEKVEPDEQIGTEDIETPPPPQAPDNRKIDLF